MALGPQFKQLKMFMTPKEIMHNYEPLSGDRRAIEQEYGPNPYRQETTEELWNRKAEEASMRASEYDEVVRDVRRRGTDLSFVSRLDNGELGTGPQYRTGHTDTYKERQESWLDNKYIEFQQNRRLGQNTSLLDSIRKSGVQSPVRLGPTEVTGGHHRIAAANQINPDMLIPVLHEQEDWPNHRDKVYPYT